VAAQGFPVSDVYETRLILEEWAVGLVAGLDSADLAGAHATLEAMEDQTLSTDEFLALDTQFHLRLTEAAGNRVVEATMAGLRSAIESYVRSGSQRIADWQSTADRLRREHAGLLRAIEAGDAEQARDLVRAHITGYYADAGLSAPSDLPTPDPLREDP